MGSLPVVKLSILVCTLTDRKPFLYRLLAQLQPQARPDMEVVISEDSGQLTIGAKRNALIETAQGDWVAFCDDDDEVVSDYVAELFFGIDKGVDVVSVQGIYTANGILPQLFVDKPYTRWATSPDGVYLRGVQHLDAVRRSLAIQVKFPDISFGEDQAWGTAMEKHFPNLTWYQVSKPIYFYRYRSKK